MKFDQTKAYGLVFGHGQAVFEQAGHLFTAAGDLVPEVERVEVPKDIPRGVDFLQTLLREGAILQSVIQAEADRQNIPWAEVLEAAAAIPIKKRGVTTAMTWGLA